MSGNAYESPYMQDITGETLRPGGFHLTQKGVEFCGLSETDQILDMGCGIGATIGYLYENYGIKATGVDVSELLLREAVKRHPYAVFQRGSGMALPLETGGFQAVFAECTLSLMETPHEAIKEASRVLEENGWLIITDVYAKNPEFIGQLQGHSVNTCLRGLFDLKDLQEKVTESGFEILLLEDCSQYLKELMVKIIFTHGSMQVFWNKTGDTGQMCSIGCDFQSGLKACKPGYFLLIAKKGA
ncbi:MAG: arsenite methyltransferase [Clostridiales bacterium]|jgi:ubiquinone/menaquinone biosynthesis C-methylase UbiE|nr:arsenite methyltransferase [Clostridiales bacterium]